jgi:methylated-DNA-[protein]-cysteine S-methyltransferase
MQKEYYGYYSTPIGLLEIIATDDFIVSVMFTDKSNKVTKQPQVLKYCIKQLDEYFKGIRKEFNIVPKLSGTEFQIKVWNALNGIPYGKTLSYKDIAVKTGNDKAARAVGNANNKNKISIIIPCHRVIGKDGSLTGYAGGQSRKQWLLEHEKRICRSDSRITHSGHSTNS